MFYNYDSYCAMYEDVFEWILEASDELHAMDDLADDLETIKCQVRPQLKLELVELYRGSNSFSPN